MTVEKGHLLIFSYKSAEKDCVTLDLEADASPLVPWGMGFRLGMYAKGDSDQSVNFLQTSISS